MHRSRSCFDTAKGFQVNSKWTGPDGYMKRHSQAMGTFTRHKARGNCWVGFVEGRPAIAYIRNIRPGAHGNKRECLVIFDDPIIDGTRSEIGEQ